MSCTLLQEVDAECEKKDEEVKIAMLVETEAFNDAADESSSQSENLNTPATRASE
jgi:hypothetical protein